MCDGSLRNAARVAIDCRMPDFSLTPRSSVKPDTSATYRTKLSEQCVFRLSVTKCHLVTVRSLCTVWRMWARKSASVRVGPHDGQTTSPLTTSKLIMNDNVP